MGPTPTGRNEKMRCNKLCLNIGFALLLGMSSCAPTYKITSGSENLLALAKITEGDNLCTEPGGSVESTILLFNMELNSKEKNIYKKDNPVAPSQVQVTSGSVCTYPTYCVASERIAFSREVNGYNDIYMLPVSGNALIPVTETNGINEIAPSISPDGTLVAYQKGTLNSTDAEIWVKNLTTGENMLLGKGATPSISPDGKKIAFAKIESNNSRNIWVMDIDGCNAQQLTVSKEEFAGFPKWSPKGDKIVYQANKKKGNFDIFIMNSDGTGLMQLTTNESDDLTPFWSKDGYIYISSDRGGKKGHFNIWRFLYMDYRK